MGSPAGELEIGGPSGEGQPSLPLPTSAGVSRGWRQQQSSLSQEGFRWETKDRSLLVAVDSFSQTEQFLPDLNHPEDDDNVQLLVCLLNVATKLEVKLSRSLSYSGALILLAKALEMVDHPLPELSSLRYVTADKEEKENVAEVAKLLFKAMQSGKFSRLEKFTCRGVVDLHIQYVAESIEAGHLPMLQDLRLYGTGTLSRFKDVAESHTRTGHLALSKVLGSGHLPGVKILHLERIGMKDDGCDNYAEALRSGSLQELEELDFERNEIGDRGAKALGHAFAFGQVKRLKVLDLGSNDIAEDGMDALATSFEAGQLPDLRILNLSGNKFKEEGFLSLVRALASGHLSTLQTLRIAGNEIGDRGAKALGHAFASGQVKRLKVLDLADNDIAEARMDALATSFEAGQLPDLRCLHLSKNKFKEEGFLSLVRALASGHLSTLQTLGISRNDIGDIGAKALGHAFASGGVKRLEHLYLSDNSITKDGMDALATSFEAGQLPDLHWLFLRDNPLEDEGLRSLARALASGHLNALQYLPITDSGCSKEGLEAIVGAFSKNKGLTASVFCDWHLAPQLEVVLNELVKSNQNTAKFLAELKEERVPAKYSKVYLCGNQLVGKTTLKKSMKRSFWKALFSFERRPHSEDRTRGIEVSEICSKGSKSGEKPMTLVVWDMAGQNEYHLVHNAFFPDLSFAEGKATTFVIVCTSKDREKTEEHLKYWLRFIASSCAKNIQNPRHVLVVLNRMHGDSDVLNHADDWVKLLKCQRKEFKGYLEIHSHRFIVDVRKRRSVKSLKRYLLKHSRQMLAEEKVPEICQLIQKNLSVWSNDRKQFPVLCWTEFVEQVETISPRLPERTIEAAAKYLNEAGVVIYIDKEFPTEWGIPNRKLIVLDPNWFCREVVGNMFLPENMVNAREDPFTKKVDRSTGSISISQIGEFFRPMRGKWDDSQMKDLVRILLWLGLCYKGKDDNLFIPPLIHEDVTRGDSWGPGNPRTHVEGQWVMGFSVAHQQTLSGIALPPIALWHRFQVDLGQTPRFNGLPDNDFVVGKYFMTFKVDFMAVKIEVNASQYHPTFDVIDIFVKPLLSVDKDDLDANTRKQWQVDLASNLVDTLLRLGNQVCPGVTYTQRVVWPWPASHPRKIMPERNEEVEDVKKRVQQHGLRSMNWTVGDDDTITEAQLLSTKDKVYVLESLEGRVRALQAGIKEAVKLKIFPSDMLIEEGTSTTTSKMGEIAERPTTQAPTFVSPDLEIIYKKLNSMHALDNMHLKVTEGVRDDVRKVMTTVQEISNNISQAMGTQKKLLLKVQNIDQIFLEDRERSCPRFIYLGRKNSGDWMSLKEAMSPVVKVHLHFACEAKYSDYGQHPVTNQPGLDVSDLKNWARKVLPWLKVSLTVLFISAKIAAHVVAPGLGLAIPDFSQWQQASSLAQGIADATGYSLKEFDNISAGIETNGNSTMKTPQELYGFSKRAMTEFLKKLTPQDYEKKLGLLKVWLDHGDGTKRVAWICSACYEQYRTSPIQCVRDL